MCNVGYENGCHIKCINKTGSMKTVMLFRNDLKSTYCRAITAILLQ